MKRCFGWSLLFMAGILIGSIANPSQRIHADPPGDADAAPATQSTNEATLAELKEIKGELKEIHVYLQKGVVKTIAVMNPDLKE
jgi:hypothetical protein